MKPNPSKVTTDVMHQIKSGKVQMRPRWQFTLATAIGISSLVATTLITVFLVNLIVFKVHVSIASRPTHGAPLFSYFTGHFPWLALVLGIIGIILAIWLARKRDFSYRFGRWTLAILILLSLGIGTALAYTSLNNKLENFGPMRGIYGNHSSDMLKQNQKQKGSGSTNRSMQPGNKNGTMPHGNVNQMK